MRGLSTCRKVIGRQVRGISGNTDPRLAMKAMQGQLMAAGSLVKFAPWGVPVGMVGLWCVWPALGDENRASAKFLMTLGLTGKNPFRSE
mmetsp:Transcript_2994/g.5665  ORF Transcript_2994/g.5665 Transcript_2994/m.5665 type:complete len:89 (+) Transcript_2994:21-287(+)